MKQYDPAELARRLEDLGGLREHAVGSKEWIAIGREALEEAYLVGYSAGYGGGFNDARIADIPVSVPSLGELIAAELGTDESFPASEPLQRSPRLEPSSPLQRSEPLQNESEEVGIHVQSNVERDRQMAKNKARIAAGETITPIPPPSANMAARQAGGYVATALRNDDGVLTPGTSTGNL